VRSEEEIRKRLEMWEEFARLMFKAEYPYEGEAGRKAEEIRKKLGYSEDLLTDFYYDGEAGWLIVNELRWVLGEVSKNKKRGD